MGQAASARTPPLGTSLGPSLRSARRGGARSGPRLASSLRSQLPPTGCPGLLENSVATPDHAPRSLTAPRGNDTPRPQQEREAESLSRPCQGPRTSKMVPGTSSSNSDSRNLSNISALVKKKLRRNLTLWKRKAPKITISRYKSPLSL